MKAKGDLWIAKDGGYVAKYTLSIIGENDQLGPGVSWFDVDGDFIRVNTNEGRVKDTNMKQRPRVAMVIQDPNDPYRYLGMRGEVASYTTEGADEHINKLSLKYDGESWTYRPDQKRIIYKLRPLHFDRHG